MYLHEPYLTSCASLINCITVVATFKLLLRSTLLPLSVQGDLRGFNIRVFPLHLRTMHEVAERVEGLRFPVYSVGAVLVYRRSIAGVLDVQRLKVMHGTGHQVTYRGQ